MPWMQEWVEQNKKEKMNKLMDFSILNLEEILHRKRTHHLNRKKKKKNRIRNLKK